ncbi:hypothetical protein TWF694_004643 [Orbilia ellipsospora]|uniref:Zn(2)-C6 fungal-type domain-containing protein n=1 Tax=Orbilia ellipsospora TaxID=2528407 RepID=A0AAV9WX20_9PEZI
MDKVSDSPFVSLQPAQFTPHSTVLHFRQEQPSEPNSGSRIRRFHHKTRTGCRECKQKRRKCNEEKPSCQGCIKSGTECHYELVIPPRVQPKNRKRPTRKPAPNRFVFIEFDEDGSHSNRAGPVLQNNSNNNDRRELQLSAPSAKWQSAPSTCLLQGGFISDESHTPITAEVECIYLFRNFTYLTLPMQTYDPKMWGKVTFEFSYSQEYLYHTIVALALSHQRFIRGQSERQPQEVSHYMKALTGFRAVISDSKNTLALNQRGWIALMVTSATLSMYIMSASIGSFETSCDTYFSLSRGTMEMLMETMKRGVPMVASGHEFIGRRIQSIFALEGPLIREFPGLDYASSGDYKAITRASAQEFSTILRSLTIQDRHSMNVAKALALLKPTLEWASRTDAALVQHFRAKSTKAYLVMAHYFAALWKIKVIIEEISNKGLWQEESGTVDLFWWLKLPKDLCKRSIELLEEEPIERISWVKNVIQELESG